MVHKKGFTLIELMIVVVIIGILTAIAIPVYLTAVDNAKKVVAMSGAKTVYTYVSAMINTPTELDDNDDISLIRRWINGKNNAETIRYKGPTDNSVTKPTGYHDAAKNAIRHFYGGTVPFGYVMIFGKDTDNNFVITNFKIYYKKPANAAIAASKSDFDFCHMNK